MTATTLQWSDPYSATARASAVREIDRAAVVAYIEHRSAGCTSVANTAEEAMQFLRQTKNRSNSAGNEHKARAIAESLDGVYRLTHAKDTELRLRNVELQARTKHATRLPDAEALAHWLRQQADAAVCSDPEHRYFTELAQTNLSESDPWTVSRQLVRRLSSPNDAEQAEKLRAAHGRLVRVLACGLSIQPPSSSEQQLPDGFSWQRAYDAIQSKHRFDRERDNPGAAASATALREIDQAVTTAYELHLLKRTYRYESACTAEKLQSLRAMRQAARKPGQQARLASLEKSLDYIYRLTHARKEELQRRSACIQPALLSAPARLPMRESLGKWQRERAVAVQDPGVQHRYNVELPDHFKWLTAYHTIRLQRQIDSDRDDVYAAAASASALCDIEQAVVDAYTNHVVIRFSGKDQPSPETMLNNLTHMRNAAGSAWVRPRVEAIGRSIDGIYQLTHARSMELRIRSDVLKSEWPFQSTPAPDWETLGRWLRDQAHGSEPERWYFTQLAQGLAQGHDPWTVSRALIENLPGSGTAESAERLQAAHRHLVRAMCGSSSQQAPEPPRGVVSAARESRAAASMRQEIVARLSNRSPLSDEQVRGVLVAVTHAAASGTLGASTSQPEAWARGLLERVLASFQKRIDDLTELETIQESPDVKRLGELLERLDCLGLL